MTRPRLRFQPPGAFERDLQREVRVHFARTGAPSRGASCHHRKALLILGWHALSWSAAVLLAATWWQAALAVVSLALATAAIPMNLAHDGAHSAFSSSRGGNALAAWTANVFAGIGIPWWRIKHGTLHHGFTRVPGLDDDLDQGALLRLHPDQPRHWWHRWQHVHAWALYPFLHLALLVAGVRFLATGRVGSHVFARPRPRTLLAGLAATAAFVTLTVGIPLALHPPWAVATAFLAGSGLVGLVLATIFQVEHCIEAVRSPVQDAATGRAPVSWARAQLEATQDFAPGNRLLTWYCGALNYHVEHHLFPRVAHVHLPELAGVVDRVARAHGLERRVAPSWTAALREHQAWLRELGRVPVEEVEAASASAPVQEAAPSLRPRRASRTGRLRRSRRGGRAIAALSARAG